VSREWLSGDLLAMVKKKSVVKRERLRLSAEELLELPDYAAYGRDKAVIHLAMNTALRAGEIASLRVKDLDMANLSLRVQVHKSSREDVMPVTQELAEAMHEWLREYKRQFGELQPDWFLFPARKRGNGSAVFLLDPERPIAKMASIVQKAMIAAGHTIERGEGIHTLRRSVARVFFDQACAAGHDAALRMTSSFLHHASTQVTEGYLGLQHERLSRDEILRGQRFLSLGEKSVELSSLAV
jgi:integrase